MTMRKWAGWGANRRAPFRSVWRPKAATPRAKCPTWAISLTMSTSSSTRSTGRRRPRRRRRRRPWHRRPSRRRRRPHRRRHRRRPRRRRLRRRRRQRRRRRRPHRRRRRLRRRLLRFRRRRCRRLRRRHRRRHQVPLSPASPSPAPLCLACPRAPGSPVSRACPLRSSAAAVAAAAPTSGLSDRHVPLGQWRDHRPDGHYPVPGRHGVQHLRQLPRRCGRLLLDAGRTVEVSHQPARHVRAHGARAVWRRHRALLH